jgi:hypothetical protein
VKDRLVYKKNIKITSSWKVEPGAGIRIPFEDIPVDPEKDRPWGIVEVAVHTEEGNFYGRAFAQLKPIRMH